MARILHISTRLILGGSQENTVLSCEGQARLGHEVHLAFGPIYGPEGSLLDRVQGFNKRCASGEETTADGRACAPIRTHTVPHLIRELSPRSDRRGLEELKQLIRELEPDIVHTHSSKAGILGRAAAYSVFRQAAYQKLIQNLPPGQKVRWHYTPRGIVHTIHGPPFMPLEGSPLQRLKTRAVNKLYEVAERYAARRCHTITSVADAMTRQFLARKIGRPSQYVTVYSGMEIEPFLTPARGETRAEVRARLGFSRDDIVIGTVARLAEHKGHDDLLDALATDLKSDPKLKLLWVGDGWWRRRLLDKGRTLKLTVREIDLNFDTITHYPESAHRPLPVTTPAPQLTLTGLLPPTLIPAHIRAMDILAHPSYREGLPRTVPQALLCGVPPVAYDIDGTAEVCQDNITGRLIARPGDLAALRRAILDLAADPATRAVLASRGRELCRTRFSAQTMVNHLEQVYERARGEAVIH